MHQSRKVRRSAKWIGNSWKFTKQMWVPTWLPIWLHIIYIMLYPWNSMEFHGAPSCQRKKSPSFSACTPCGPPGRELWELRVEQETWEDWRLHGMMARSKDWYRFSGDPAIFWWEFSDFKLISLAELCWTCWIRTVEICGNANAQAFTQPKTSHFTLEANPESRRLEDGPFQTLRDGPERRKQYELTNFNDEDQVYWGTRTASFLGSCQRVDSA